MSDHFKFNDLVAKSEKTKIHLQIIKTEGIDYRIYPHFMRFYMRGTTANVETLIFLSRWTPFWALAEYFRGNSMYWYTCHNLHYA